MAYTTIDKSDDYFNTVLYTGDGTTNRTITTPFSPEFTWIKMRSGADDNVLYDIVRQTNSGVGLRVKSNSTEAESDLGDYVNLITNGFKISGGTYNNSGYTFASWNWLAGGTPVSNTDGSITSSVSANTTAGFSIVSWTGNGSNGATIGHGLGTTPAIVITKRRNTTGDWQIGGSLIDTVRGGANSLLLLNTTAAMDSNSEVYQTFSSTTFQVGVNAYANTSGSTMISYCFAEKKGFSKFGSYVGNGSTDGTFVFTGMKPAFVLLKNTNTGDSWRMVDNKRSPYNVVKNFLNANSSGAESTSVENLDFTSNGFKLRVGTADFNGSGNTFIYMAFAENPLVGTNNTPATAR